MDGVDMHWHPIDITPYGAVLHIPRGWEALPPVPANGHEILRASGGRGHHLIVFKFATASPDATTVAAGARDRLERAGFEDFTLTEAPFAGTPGAVLEFVSRGEGRAFRSREYFAVRGPAVFVVGMGSHEWDRDVALIEQIASRFEVVDPGAR